MKYEIGQSVLVYDPRIWNQQGRDMGSNEHCWKEANIKNIRTNVKSLVDSHVYPVLFDVEFLHDGFFSKGHFKESVKSL